MVKSHTNSVPRRAPLFPTTLWSVVLAAGEEPSDRAKEALARLCQLYWYPLYAFLRRRGESAHDAEDLTQGFFAHLLSNHRLSQVSPAKGKFRSFLLASLRNFQSDQRDKARARKRGGDQPTTSLDTLVAEQRYAAEPSDPSDPEKIFERRWALTILERTLARLEAEMVKAGKQARWSELRIFLLGDRPGLSYEELAVRLGTSEAAVKMAVVRLRQRFRELFRMEIANTVEAEDDIDDEVRHVYTVLKS